MKVYPSNKMTAGQTNWPYVINLGNSIIGVSVLTMPFCFKTCGVLLGPLLLLGSAWLTSISCNLLVKAAFTSRRRSYQYLAFHAIGQGGKLFVEICMIGLLIGTSIAFYVIMGDLGPAIISRVLGIENTDSLRTGLLVVMALGIALPLALLRNLDSLSNINAISLGFYAVFVAEVFTAAFPNLWSGLWVTKVTYWNPEGIFRCLPIFSLAFSCQTQLFVMYDALPEPSLQRMHYITKSAIGMCVAVYLCVGYFGYVAFCDDEIQGDILMNFRPTIFSEAVKFGFVLSIAVSFPLVVFPCRASIYTMFFAKDHTSHDNISGSLVIPPYHFNVITLGIILGTMTIGILVPNIEFVLAMTGATMGSMICLIVPAVVFIRIMSLSKTNSNATAQFVLFLGVTVFLASTYITLNTQVTQTKDTESVIKVVQPEDNVKPVDDRLVKDAAIGNDAIIKVPDGDADKDRPVRGLGPHEDVDLKGNAQEHLIEDKAQNLAKESDKRHEPPNPLAPLEKKVDQNVDADSKVKDDSKDDKKDKRDGDKMANEDKQLVDKNDDTNGKQDEKVDKQVVADGDKEKNEDKPEPDGKMKEEHADLNGHVNEEAKNILKELKEQQQEQKMLIEEQKQIIQDLKQHQKEAHQVDVNEANQIPAQQQPVGIEGQQQAIQQNVIQQQNVQAVPQQQQQQPIHVVPQQQPQQQQPILQQQQPQQPEQQPVQVVPQQQQQIQQHPVQIVPQEQQHHPVEQVIPQQQAVQQEVPQKQAEQVQPGVQQIITQQPAVPQQPVLQQNVEPQQILQNIDLNIQQQQELPQQQQLPQQQPLVVQGDVAAQVPQLPVQNKKLDDSLPAAGVIVNRQEQQQQNIGQNPDEEQILKKDINQHLVNLGGVRADKKFIIEPNEVINNANQVGGQIIRQPGVVGGSQQMNVNNQGMQPQESVKIIQKETVKQEHIQQQQQQPLNSKVIADKQEHVQNIEHQAGASVVLARKDKVANSKSVINNRGHG